MKYKVSLLPEAHRKKLNSKKKIEKIRIIALVTLALLLGLLVIVLGVKYYADSKLADAKKLDSEFAQRVQELEQYRQINADLKEKVQLLDNIKVEEPYLYHFLVKLGNMEHPGLSVETIECVDWKTARTCTISGSCDTREAYLAYEKALSEDKQITSVTNLEYAPGVGTENGLATFSIAIVVNGGKADPGIQPAESASFAATTIVDTSNVD